MFALLVAAGFLPVVAGSWGIYQWLGHAATATPGRQSMLLAPLIGVMEPCITVRDRGEQSDYPADLVQSCVGERGSAAALIEATLKQLEPAGTGQDAHQKLGYTLAVPLLELLRLRGEEWEIDTAMVRRFVRTIEDSPRSVILYLFSTHFATGGAAEHQLAHDQQNIAQNRNGALPQGTYYGAPIYNWTVASTGNTLTELRLKAIEALANELCRLPTADLAKIKGVTLLGEVHHLFPDFEQGMGFDLPYLATDYSEAADSGFRRYLQQLFPSIGQLNQQLGSSFASFAEVKPPSKDIRSEPLQNFFEHMDSFAHGVLPVSGWVDPRKHPLIPTVHIYLDGKPLAQVPVSQRRQDVLEAHPALGTADTGWRYDLDFRQLAPGFHRIDIFLKEASGPLVRLDTRTITVMDASQRSPVEHAQAELPLHLPQEPQRLAHVDEPKDLRSYYYNPLAPLWLAFRERQVQAYIAHFARAVQSTCLTRNTLYSHQIYPYANPSWDHNKFGVGQSLRPNRLYTPGVSLYGEAAYGHDFLRWTQAQRMPRYGVTEFHPLKPMEAEELGEVFQRHERNGARFLSFFLEPRWDGRLMPRGHNIFSLDPDNARFGSDRLYKAVNEHLSKEHRSKQQNSGK